MFKAFCLCPALKSNLTKNTTEKALQYVRFYRVPASGPWTIEDDVLLRNYRGPKHGISWEKFVETTLPHRTVAQCRNRWTRMYKDFFKENNNVCMQGEQRLEKAVEKVDANRKEVTAIALPHRFASQYCKELTKKAASGVHVPWTPEETNTLFRAVDMVGHSWTRISREFLPSRKPITLRSRYLFLTAEPKEWTDAELELLEESARAYDQNWLQVAEKLANGRTAAQCHDKWLEIQPESAANGDVVDASSYQDDWKMNELSIFWERLIEYEGDFAKVAAELPGRNDRNCRYKFWATMRFDVKFLEMYGEKVKQSIQEKQSVYRTRIAKLYHEWLRIKTDPIWSEDQLEKLEKLVKRRRGIKKNLSTADWEVVSEAFPGKSLAECKHQFNQITDVNFVRKPWQFDELLRLVELVYKHRLKTQEGEDLWTRVAKELNTGRSSSACQARYNYMKQTGHRFVM